MKYVAYLIILSIAGCSQSQPTQPAPKPTVEIPQQTKTVQQSQPKKAETKPEKKYYTMKELRGLVMFKTREEVAAAIGKPDFTEYRKVGIENIDHWIYKRIVKDEYAKNPEYETVLRFGDATGSDKKSRVNMVNP